MNSFNIRIEGTLRPGMRTHASSHTQFRAGLRVRGASALPPTRLLAFLNAERHTGSMSVETYKTSLPEKPSTEDTDLHPEQLLRIAKGFSRVFWGIPITILLFIEIPDTQFIHQIRLPTYVLGVILMYSGFSLFKRVKSASARWRSLLRFGVSMLFLQVYFAPFVYWWRNNSFSDYHLYNILMLIGCMMILLIVINRMTGELGDQVKDRVFRIESNLCVIAVILLMVLPFAAIAGYSILGTFRFGTSLHMELVHTHRGLANWIHALFLMPITFTMIVSWKAKELCLEKLKILAVFSSEKWKRMDGHTGSSY